MTRKQRREARRAGKAEKENTHETIVEQRAEETIPEPPLSIEEPERVTAEKASETFSFSLVRQMYKTNGVPFVYSLEGESYASIANDYHLFLREILRFNDAVSDKRLEPGTTVYLQSKKSQTKRGLDKYISDEGRETLYELSQRFGVKLMEMYPYRIQRVKWSDTPTSGTFQATLRVITAIEPFIINQIMDVLNTFRTSLRQFNVNENQRNGTYDITMKLSVPSNMELDKVTSQIKILKNVVKVVRQ